MEFTGKTLEELVPGDIVRAKSSISRKKKKRNKSCDEHTFVIIELPEKGKSHKICVPACSFTEKCPKGEEGYCIDISGHNLPASYFGKKKDIKQSILRLYNPDCIKKFQYQGHLNSLTTNHPLYIEICETIQSLYGSELGDFEGVCACSCEVLPEVSYCENIQETYVGPESQLICRNCHKIITEGVSCFMKCHYCNENDSVLYLDCHTCLEVIYHENGIVEEINC